MRRIDCKALLCALLACLMLGAGEMRGVVLCIGSDGHVAVEPAHGESPACPCGACGEIGDALASTEETPCGNCIDIPLSLCGADRIAVKMRAAAGGPENAPAWVSGDTGMPQAQPVHAGADARRSLPLDPSLLRSVVLRL